MTSFEREEGWAFHPTADRIASAARDGGIEVWDSGTGKPVHTLRGQGAAPARSVAVTRDGKTVVAASGNATLGAETWVLTWNIVTGVQEQVGWSSGRTTCTVLSPDGEFVLVGRLRRGNNSAPVGSFELRGARGSNLLDEWESGPEDVVNACVAGDGAYLAVLTSGGNIRVHPVGSGLFHRLADRAFPRRFQETTAGTVCLSPGGRTLVTGGEDGVLRVRFLRDEVALRHGRKRVAFSGDGGKVVAVGEKAVLDPTTGLAIEQWQTPLGVQGATNAEPGCIDISPDARYVTDGVELIDRTTNQRTFPFFRNRPSVKSVAFSPDGRLMGAVALPSRAGAIFELNPPRLRATLWKPAAFGAISGRWVSCCRFSPDGRTFAVGFNTIGDGGCGEVQLWDVESGALRLVFDRHYFSVWDLAFSPDGRTLAGACGSYSRGRAIAGEVKIWDVSSGRQLATLDGFSNCVWGVSFSPDGKRLAAGSGDRGPRDEWEGESGEVRVWDLAASQIVVSLRQASPVYGVAYSPDGKRFAVVGVEGMGRIWGPP